MDVLCGGSQPILRDELSNLWRAAQTPPGRPKRPARSDDEPGRYSLDWDNRHDERLLPGITTELLRPVERPNQRGQIGVRDPRLETETRYRTSIELSEERGVLCVSVVLL